MEESPGFLAKTWAGVKGFVGGIFTAIPRTIVWTLGIFAASEALGAVGFDILHIGGSGNDALLSRLGMSLCISGAISGAMGAYQGVNGLTQQPVCPLGGASPQASASEHAPHQHFAQDMPQPPAHLPARGNLAMRPQSRQPGQ